MGPDGHDPVRARVADLYARYSEELFGFIRSMLPVSKVDAGDLLQQVFVEALGWMSRHPDARIEHPRGFLYTIARRLLRKYREQLARTPTRQTDDTVDPLDFGKTAEEDDVEYLARQGETRRVLLRAMRRLGEAHSVDELQVVLYLRHWADMTEAEVGEVLGLKRAAVRRRLEKAIRQLLAQLQELEAREPDSTRTSTELLRRWWRQLEHEAGKERLEGDEDEDAGIDGDGDEVANESAEKDEG